MISPEGCASILWKSAERAPDAAETMGIYASRLKSLGLIDKVVNEPVRRKTSGSPGDVPRASSGRSRTPCARFPGSIPSVRAAQAAFPARLMSYGKFEIAVDALLLLSPVGGEQLSVPARLEVGLSGRLDQSCSPACPRQFARGARL